MSLHLILKVTTSYYQQNVAIANNKKQVEQSQRHYSLELKQVKSQKLPQNFRFPLLHTTEKL